MLTVPRGDVAAELARLCTATSRLQTHDCARSYPRNVCCRRLGYERLYNHARQDDGKDREEDTKAIAPAHKNISKVAKLLICSMFSWLRGHFLALPFLCFACTVAASIVHNQCLPTSLVNIATIGSSTACCCRWM